MLLFTFQFILDIAPPSLQRPPVGLLRPAVLRHLDAQVAAVEHAPVQRVHRVLGIPLVVEPGKGVEELETWEEEELEEKWEEEEEPDECEAARLSGELILGDEDVPDLAVLLEQILYVVRGGFVGQVVHLERDHVGGVGRRAAHVPGHPGAGADSETWGLVRGQAGRK